MSQRTIEYEIPRVDRLYIPKESQPYVFLGTKKKGIDQLRKLAQTESQEGAWIFGNNRWWNIVTGYDLQGVPIIPNNFDFSGLNSGKKTSLYHLHPQALLGGIIAEAVNAGWPEKIASNFAIVIGCLPTPGDIRTFSTVRRICSGPIDFLTVSSLGVLQASVSHEEVHEEVNLRKYQTAFKEILSVKDFLKLYDENPLSYARNIIGRLNQVMGERLSLSLFT